MVTTFAIIAIITLFIELGGFVKKVLLPIFICIVIGVVILKYSLEWEHKRKVKRAIDQYVRDKIDYFLSLIEKNKIFDEKKQKYTISSSFYDEIDLYIKIHLDFLMVEYFLTLKNTRILLILSLSKELQKLNCVPDISKEILNSETVK